MDCIGLLRELEKRSLGLSVILLTAHARHAPLHGARDEVGNILKSHQAAGKGSSARRGTAGAANVGIYRRERGVADGVPHPQLAALGPACDARMVANTDTSAPLTRRVGNRQGAAGARDTHVQPATQRRRYRQDCGLRRRPARNAYWLRCVLPRAARCSCATSTRCRRRCSTRSRAGTARPGQAPMPQKEDRRAGPGDQRAAAGRAGRGTAVLGGSVPPAQSAAVSKRREDIPLLVCASTTRCRMSPQALEVRGRRQLAGQRAEAAPGRPGKSRRLAVGAVISPELVKQAMGQTTRMPSFDEARDEFTRGYLTQLLQIT